MLVVKTDTLAINLTHFSSMSGGIEMWHWTKISLKKMSTKEDLINNFTKF